MMRHSRTGLILVSACYLVSASVGAAVAMATHLPARFAGILRGNDVARDFLTLNGTALSPDLALLLCQVALTGCALQTGRAGRAGVIGLTLLGAAYTFGQLGEPIAVQAFSPATRNAAQASLVAINIVCSSVMFVFGILEWRRRAQVSWSAGQGPDRPTSESWWGGRP